MGKIPIFILLAMAAADRERDFVLTVWRHGKRSPMQFIKAFNDSLEIWPDGEGQLTAQGVAIHQELGDFLRNRYKDFISPDYKREEIYVRSTDRDRTLLSAVANIGAFYNISTPGYMPVPIHTRVVENDGLLRAPISGCDKYDKIKNEINDTPFMKELNIKYKEELKIIAELAGSATGITVTNTTLIDALDCHIANDLPDIEGVTPELLKTWRYLGARAMEALFTDLEHKRRVEVSRLNGGVILGDIITQLNHPFVQPDIHDDKDVPVKYIVYSAHDTTVASILIAMDVWDEVQPYYASALLYERFSDGTVEIYFRNGTEVKDLHDMTSRVCHANPCYIKDLEEVWRPVIPLDLDAECNNYTATRIVLKPANTLGILLAGSWLLFILYVCCSRPRKQEQDQVHLINSEFSMSLAESDKQPWQSVPVEPYISRAVQI